MLSLAARRCRPRFALSLRCYSTGQHDEAGKPFQILFFGRDEFSCTVLEQLHRAQDVWKDLHVVTQPDMKTGRRGCMISVSPLKTLANELSLPVHEIPPDRPSFRHWQPPPLFSEPPPPPTRMLITASFGRILSDGHLNCFLPGRRLNVHPSLLPLYRGPAPIQRTLLDGRTETGVSVIEMMEKKRGIDAGEIWAQRRFDMSPDANFVALRNFLAQQGGLLLVSVLRDMIRGTIQKPTPQAWDPSTPRAPLITADDALVDFATMTAEVIVRRHRAISHQKPLFAYLMTGRTLQLHQPSVYINLAPELAARLTEPGMAAFDVPTKSLAVRCANGTVLRVDQVKQQDRSLLQAKQWWNGIRPEMTVPAGDCGDAPVIRLVSHVP